MCILASVLNNYVQACVVFEWLCAYSRRFWTTMCTLASVFRFGASSMGGTISVPPSLRFRSSATSPYRSLPAYSLKTIKPSEKPAPASVLDDSVHTRVGVG